MTELYWITRLDSICVVLMFIAIISTGCLIVGVITRYGEEFSNKEKKAARKWIKYSLAILILSVIAKVFTPSTKDAYIIYGVGNTIDYLKSSKEAKKLPDNALKALNSYLESIREENDSDKVQGLE